MHYKDQALEIRQPSIEDPLRVMISACLAGRTCGYDGTNNGEYPQLHKLLQSPLIRMVPFCPEEYSFGSPREMCDIYGGNGLDVLEGRAKVLTPSGADWTEGLVNAAERMYELAIKEKVEFAIMMDISAACGSTVIYDGNRFSENKVYQTGMGVCAARLVKGGVRVFSQRDFAYLQILYHAIDPEHAIDSNAINHHQTAWYKEYFNS